MDHRRGSGKSLKFAFGTQFFRNMVFKTALGLPHVPVGARHRRPTRGRADPQRHRPRPEAIPARGGKLILYHGWSDAAIPAVEHIDYYRA